MIHSSTLARRTPLIDLLKGGSALLILFHHLASYGPLAQALEQLLPTLSGWLFDYGRMVVQVFLVVAGYLAARSLAPEGRPVACDALRLIGRRYIRLVPPFIVAMLLAMVAAAIARGLFDDDMIPARPTLVQFLAHALMLHGVLDVPSLSAGVWYVAIDLQLFAMLAILFGVSRQSSALQERAAWLGVAVLAVLSLFVFNRDPEFDGWGIYFFGSYALGAAVCYCQRQKRPLLWLAAVFAVAGLALVVDFRLRIALALATAMLLALTGMLAGMQAGNSRARPLEGRPTGACCQAIVGWLGRKSYAVFLVHFPVCLLANAVFVRFTAQSAQAAVAATVAALAASLVLAAIFHRHVECRERWLPAVLLPRWRFSG